MKGYSIFDEMRKDWTLRMKIREKIWYINAKIYYFKRWIKLQLLECQIELSLMCGMYHTTALNVSKYICSIIFDASLYNDIYTINLEKQYKKLSRKK